MMMNDFYAIAGLDCTADSIRCVATFNKEHSIFEGHFPGQPIVPGVCMIQMVKDLLEQLLGKSLLLRSTGQVKFLQLITPEISPEVNISWKVEGNTLVVNAVFMSTAPLFKLSGTYEVQ